jgi:hypothetical protein
VFYSAWYAAFDRYSGDPPLQNANCYRIVNQNHYQ